VYKTTGGGGKEQYEKIKSIFIVFYFLFRVTTRRHKTTSFDHNYGYIHYPFNVFHIFTKSQYFTFYNIFETVTPEIHRLKD